MASHDNKDIQHILAALNAEGAADETPLPDEETQATIHVYPVEGGGILFTKTPLEEDQQPHTIIDSEVPLTPKRRELPYFLYFVLMLCVFLLLDMANSELIALMTPTVTVTIMPNVQSITLRSSTQLGKRVSPITLSQSQTVPTTGHRHQDARQATGILTFYNSQLNQITVPAGTTLTGSDGIQVITDQDAPIPPESQTIPPTLGQASVLAHAVTPGSTGNIPTGDINQSCCAVSMLVQNAAFHGGLDERDYMVVTQQDRDSAATAVQAKVSASMTAALQEQIPPTQQLQPLPCTPTVSADRQIGEEATQVQVTVSETCTAIAYNTQELNAQATRLLATQAAKAVGKGYRLYGNVQVSVTQATTPPTTSVVVLAFTCQGTYVHQLNANTQQSIVHLIAGEPRLTALHQLERLPGIHTVHISGIADNQQIPIDAAHIHLFIILPVF